MNAAEREAARRWPVPPTMDRLSPGTGEILAAARVAFVAGAAWQAEQDAAAVAERDAARAALARAHEVREAGVTAAAEIARLRATLDAVRALHEPITAIHAATRTRTQVCSGCGTDAGGWVAWPCPTIRAIEGDET